MKNALKVLFLGVYVQVFTLGLTCGADIKGDLTLLVEQESAYSPQWSTDGTKIYFVESLDEMDAFGPGYVWSVDISNKQVRQESEDTLGVIDFSPAGNLCVTYLEQEKWIRVFDTETWTLFDSIAMPDEAFEDWRNKFYSPRFSYDSNDVFYYHYHVYSDSSYLHKVNLVDFTDEVILTTSGSSPLAPGPGDSLIAFGDTIYNLNSQERIFIDIPEEYIQSSDWNPADPKELLISSGPQDDILVFDLDTKEASRLDIHKTVKSGWVGDAQYSPEGDRIVFGTLDSEATWSLCQFFVFDPEE
ncbi:WD40 repeat domain-containing protein [candidate division WOR-3 bacterium]|nr:WD40 repeat domain-containing protein [candidate division WOR-3 bacterium]